MKRFSLGDRVPAIMAALSLLAMFSAMVTVSVPSVSAAAPAAMSAEAKALARIDDDWSRMAATRDAEKLASFYAESAVAYPPSQPMAVGSRSTPCGTLIPGSDISGRWRWHQ